jgi:glycogen operon protein
MFFAGDEFGNTQYGNNNAYCQDNEVAWLNWNDKEKNRDIYELFKFMIDFRNDHAVIRRDIHKCSQKLPRVSTHGYTPWMDEYGWDAKQVGVMYAGSTDGKDDIVYACFNSYWEPIEITLPDTNTDKVIDRVKLTSLKYTMGPRSAIVLVWD